MALALAAPVADQDRPTLRAGVITSALSIDGRLDEADWSNAPAIENLTMLDPTEGGAPTGRTVVRVLANAASLVIGVTCFDPEPARIVSFTKERDGSFEGEDHVLIVLDPFQD